MSRTTRLLRPLRAAHWSLPLVVVGSALFISFAQPCREGPLYVEISWLLLSSCIVLWSNHVYVAPVQGLRQLGGFILSCGKDAILLLLWFIVAGIPLAIVVPAYQCYTPRARVSEVVLSASMLRSEIDERARTQGTLAGTGKGVQFKPSGRAVAGYVTESGEIITIGEDPPVVIVLTPQLVGGAVKWQCCGYPSKIVPMSCRGEN